MTFHIHRIVTLAFLFNSACSFLPTHHHPQNLPRLFSQKNSDTSSTTPNLPDYGQTPIEIDKIRLIKKWRRQDLNGQSLISQTLEEIKTSQTSSEQKQLMTKEERLQRRRSLDELGVTSFQRVVKDRGGTLDQLRRKPNPKVLQLNIGLFCNQACSHCHVESSPLRTEMMDTKVASQCLELLKNTPSITTLDITGGAPELCDNFRLIVQTAKSIRPDLEIIDRCNLTVLHEPGQEDLIAFLKQHGVRIVASLPCYSAENVNAQRGNGVFERSISALLAFNEEGYGLPNSPYKLDLVYNPLGAFLPPEQKKLKEKYKEELWENFGIRFHDLFTITNMPIKRFADFLYQRGELKEYMELLLRNFNVKTVDTLMCLDTVSVGYDGTMYDCDFNQQLGYAMGSPKYGGKTVFDIESLTDLYNVPVKYDNHCFGCTAGMGSS